VLFLGHNFQTRNARKPNKALKDSDSSLVSNKTLSQKIPSSSYRPGSGNMSQNGLKLTPLMT